jgi:hypothetical protein
MEDRRSQQRPPLQGAWRRDPRLAGESWHLIENTDASLDG